MIFVQTDAVTYNLACSIPIVGVAIAALASAQHATTADSGLRTISDVSPF